MDVMLRAKTTATAVVHGWHLRVTVGPSGRSEMSVTPPDDCGLRIRSMMLLRKRLGLAPLPKRTLSALATLAPTRAASTGQLDASPFIVPQGGAWLKYESYVIEGKEFVITPRDWTIQSAPPCN